MQKFMSLHYEPSSESLHISAKQFFFDRELDSGSRLMRRENLGDI